MSKWNRDPAETRREIARGFIVEKYGPDDTDLLDYLGRDWERDSV